MATQLAKSPSEAAKPSAKDTNDFVPVWWYFLLSPVFAITALYLRIGLQLYITEIFLTYGVMSMADQLLKQDWKNPTLKQIVDLEKDYRYKLLFLVMVAIDFIVFVCEMNNVGTISRWNCLPRIFSVANTYAIGILLAHELLHRESVVQRGIGALLLVKGFLPYYFIDHAFGHHKNVSTPLDTASAPKGMTLMEFIPRSVKGGYITAYKINPRFVTLSAIASIMFVLLVGKFFGWQAALFHVVAAAGGIAFLQTANYIEHYGLRRKMLPDGTYEKVTVRHSWNAAHVISNYYTLKLQRHSDHHENSLKSYQTLCTYEDSPQLPHGYLVCFLMANFPKFWFDMMDPLVDEYNKEGCTKGTELDALKVAEEKAQSFTRKLFVVTTALLCIDIAQRLLWR